LGGMMLLLESEVVTLFFFPLIGILDMLLSG
jgi:hypothetical protein